MSQDLRPIAVNAGLLFRGSATDTSDYQDSARGYETSPTHGDFPVQGDLELEMAVDIRAAEPGDPAKQMNETEALLRSKIAEQRQQLREMRQSFDLRHPVDEYISTLGLPAQATVSGAYPDNFTACVELTADWQIPVRIESYLVTVPVGATLAVIKLGNRWITIYNGAATTAAQTFNATGLGIVLNENDDRLLLLAGALTAGPTHFELMGFAHEIWGNA